MTMTIYCNRQPRLLLSWPELTDAERKQFDDLSEAEAADRDFVRYKGVAYDCGEFESITRVVAPHSQRPGWEKFDGFSADSFFSGVLIKFVDPDHVIMATWIA